MAASVNLIIYSIKHMVQTYSARITDKYIFAFGSLVLFCTNRSSTGCLDAIDKMITVLSPTTMYVYKP